MLAQMPDVTTRAAPRATASAPNEADAAVAVKRFSLLSAETRGCAILGPGDRSLAATGERKVWADAGSHLLEAADRAARGRCTQAHVATEEGEAYAVRLGDLAMVAVTDRFTLASLVLADMRSTLRDLANVAGVAQQPTGAPTGPIAPSSPPAEQPSASEAA
ncbi:hypothetical protein BH10ACT11_BH10ACT11_16770 [soil metagenome]